LTNLSIRGRRHRRVRRPVREILRPCPVDQPTEPGLGLSRPSPVSVPAPVLPVSASVQLQHAQPEARRFGCRAATRLLGGQARADPRREPGLGRAVGVACRNRPRGRACARRGRCGHRRARAGAPGAEGGRAGIPHASEIDDTPEHYPAGLMRSWNRKFRQLRAASRELAAQRRPGRRGGRRIVRSATLTGADRRDPAVLAPDALSRGRAGLSRAKARGRQPAALVTPRRQLPRIAA